MPIHYKSGVIPRVVSPGEALSILKEGNCRFINNMTLNHNFQNQVKLTKDSQSPFAAIVSCMDSRTAAELVFDLGIGSIFSIRVAGNIITPEVLGSLEYASAIVKTKLILILGHTGCGAVKGACDQVELGHLTSVLNKIRPAVLMEDTVSEEEHRHSGNESFVQSVARLNAVYGVEQIMSQSSVIRDLVENGEVGIVPAMYDVATGKVDFFVNEGELHESIVMEGIAV